MRPRREMFETWYKTSNIARTGPDTAPVTTHRHHHTEFTKGYENTMSGQPRKRLPAGSD